jgi:hypothetical protein
MVRTTGGMYDSIYFRIPNDTICFGGNCKGAIGYVAGNFYINNGTKFTQVSGGGGSTYYAGRYMGLTSGNYFYIDTANLLTYWLDPILNPYLLSATAAATYLPITVAQTYYDSIARVNDSLAAQRLYNAATYIPWADTGIKLPSWAQFIDSISTRVKYTDTSAMLSHYLQRVDSNFYGGYMSYFQWKQSVGAYLTAADTVNYNYAYLHSLISGSYAGGTLTLTLLNGSTVTVTGFPTPTTYTAGRGLGLTTGNAFYADSTVVVYANDSNVNKGYTSFYYFTNNGVKYTDTAALLAHYLRSIDSNFNTGYTSWYYFNYHAVKYTDTGTMLSPYLRAIDSNFNTGYFSWYQWGLSTAKYITTADTTNYNYAYNHSTISGTYNNGTGIATFNWVGGGTFTVSGFSTTSGTITGSGTANYIPAWNTSTALNNSNWQDNTATNQGIIGDTITFNGLVYFKWTPAAANPDSILVKGSANGTARVVHSPLAGFGMAISWPADSFRVDTTHIPTWYDSLAGSRWLVTPAYLKSFGYLTTAVTNVTANALSPLFTSTTATSTTTPVISYSLTSASAYSFFGNNTSSSAAPNYFVPTGTPSSTTYLRGDYTWATPSGGGATTTLVAGANILLQTGTNVYTVVGIASVTPTASTIPLNDAHRMASLNNVAMGTAFFATNGKRDTLKVDSPANHIFYGSLTDTVVLPVTSTLVYTLAAASYHFVNASTSTIAIYSSGGNFMRSLLSNTSATYTDSSTTLTTGAAWVEEYSGTPVTTVNNTDGNIVFSPTTGYVVGNLSTTISLTDGTTIASGTSTGTEIGTGSTQKLGFWGATPIARTNGDILTEMAAYGFGTLTISTADITGSNQTYTSTLTGVTISTVTATYHIQDSHAYLWYPNTGSMTTSAGGGTITMTLPITTLTNQTGLMSGQVTTGVFGTIGWQVTSGTVITLWGTNTHSNFASSTGVVVYGPIPLLY